MCPQRCQTWLTGGKGTKVGQRIASLKNRGQVDGGGKADLSAKDEKARAATEGEEANYAEPTGERG